MCVAGGGSGVVVVCEEAGEDTGTGTSQRQVAIVAARFFRDDEGHERQSLWGQQQELRVFNANTLHPLDELYRHSTEGHNASRA